MVIITVLFHSSDLDPVQAPHWSVRVRKADNPQCLLGKVHHHVPFLKCHISTYFPNWNPENILYTLFHLFKILSFLCPRLALTYRKSLPITVNLFINSNSRISLH